MVIPAADIPEIARIMRAERGACVTRGFINLFRMFSIILNMWCMWRSRDRGLYLLLGILIVNDFSFLFSKAVDHGMETSSPRWVRPVIHNIYLFSEFLTLTNTYHSAYLLYIANISKNDDNLSQNMMAIASMSAATFITVLCQLCQIGIARCIERPARVIPVELPSPVGMSP